ncbi:PIN domain-containing protein [Glycomyces paridis]|uniref:Ribonuclease VapC n=1 Tax=Glycomyces paridis TaxID=2126555 RepID=A0A4S8PMQ0_9ACTN|nr:PIN domain-containing protein [Glycomyces paridis]THV32128.1 PIN domain nuclease [Glycomyces paridis]
MIGGYLLDSSAIWHLSKNMRSLQAWHEAIAVGAFRTCEATRAEMFFSAKDAAHRDEMIKRFDSFGKIAPVPKQAWRWVETAQYKLTQRGLHRSAGPVDLLVCATAVHHDLTVLHVDNDFRTVASVMPELHERDIRPLA